MNNKFLYEELDILRKYGSLLEIPEIIEKGLSSKINLREYQIDAFKNFILYFENEKFKKNKQIHNLFHMATGSGKTVIMAGLILYLYTKGYRKFLFFVNQTNVLEKTVDNFTNNLYSKYLFNDVIECLGNNVKIKKVENFSTTVDDDIEIIFTTTQNLHLDLMDSKENKITYEDFEDNKVVFVSDESHHINSLTKGKSDSENSWEHSVMKAFHSNRYNILLEFTATCDLKDKNVLSKYRDKIVFNYPLISFRESGYTKDFQNFATDTNLWTRTLIALVMSEYRKFLFADLKLNIKPVIMLKSKLIDDSKSFYEEFFKNIKNITTDEIRSLEFVGIDVLNKALTYFNEKDDSLEILEHSIKNSFTKENTIIMNGSSDNNKEKRLLVNSLEDVENPIRLIFAVDMLNEGWDVLNLFDIVRLYDVRPGMSYTIKEAQLIGRGARYCPFVDGDEDLKYKRKYDGDLENKNRILETMYFHSKNDSKYISELKKALIETGLQAQDPIIIEYKLKDEFKASEFYKKSYVFSNKKLPKPRNEVTSIEDSMKTKVYHYTVNSGKGHLVDLFEEGEENSSLKTNIKAIKFKDIDLNVLLGTSEYFKEFQFNILQQKYPTLKSKEEFLTSDNFVGNSTLEITFQGEKLSGRNLFSAVKYALSKIATHISSLKQEFIGSTEFTPKLLNEVLRDKKIYLSSVDSNGGKGASQNNCSNEAYRLDLREENWYVFNDNYGTDQEKLFIKYFKTTIEPKLKAKDLEYYVVRNERIAELAIYSFNSGERFEPDFLLFVKNKNLVETKNYQCYVEPKGSHLFTQDEWKEKFSLELEAKANTSGIFANEYKIIGLPFFNREHKMEEFEKAVDKWIEKI